VATLSVHDISLGRPSSHVLLSTHRPGLNQPHQDHSHRAGAGQPRPREGHRCGGPHLPGNSLCQATSRTSEVCAPRACCTLEWCEGWDLPPSHVSSPRSQGASGLWIGPSELWARPTGSSIGTHRHFPSALGGFNMHFSNECAKIPRVVQPCQAQTQGLIPGHVSSFYCGRN
jgi:hypothetical protein